MLNRKNKKQTSIVSKPQSMWKNIPLLLFLFVLLISCSEDNPSDDPSNNTTDVAVTGLVGSYGCTYADISGYANLNLLPEGSGYPVVGVELSEVTVGDETSIHKAQTEALMGNIFTVFFDSLSPNTKYKYRTFVSYGGQTYYGAFRELHSKDVTNITSIGEVLEVERHSAIVEVAVQMALVDTMENTFVGVAYASSRSALHPDSTFNYYSVSVKDIADSKFTANLKGLSESSVYYYASFTEISGVYNMSAIKELETPILEHKIADAVDLGLSVKWASWNIGATAPKDYGCHYAWGEVEDKSVYSLETYMYHNNGSYVDIGTNICGTEYDVAHVKWGGGWRMPTQEEIDELCYNCTWQLTTISLNEEVYGSIGYTVTGPNGNSIFFPAAGVVSGEETFKRRGRYWSGTLKESEEGYSFIIYFNSGMRYWDTYERSQGCSIRPVIDY